MKYILLYFIIYYFKKMRNLLINQIHNESLKSLFPSLENDSNEILLSSIDESSNTILLLTSELKI
jgi:hypothetical protein